MGGSGPSYLPPGRLTAVLEAVAGEIQVCDTWVLSHDLPKVKQLARAAMPIVSAESHDR